MCPFKCIKIGCSERRNFLAFGLLDELLRKRLIQFFLSQTCRPKRQCDFRANHEMHLDLVFPFNHKYVSEKFSAELFLSYFAEFDNDKHS